MTDKEEEIIKRVDTLFFTVNGQSYPGRQHFIRKVVSDLRDNLREYFLEQDDGE